MTLVYRMARIIRSISPVAITMQGRKQGTTISGTVWRNLMTNLLFVPSFLYRDYLKFTLPLAHSLSLISWGGIEWYDGYTKANQTKALQSTIRWGTDWLIKAHPDANTLYVQVGSGEVDNNYWGKAKRPNLKDERTIITFSLP